MNKTEVKTSAAEHRIALSWDVAAAWLCIRKASLVKLVEEGKFRPPVALLKNVPRFDAEWLRADWQALRDSLQANGNPWDAVL